VRVAWFRPDTARDADDLAALLDGLRETHEVRVVDAAAAHDFVWQMAQGACDLCVYELDDSAAHQYIWPYLLHYPGILALRTVSLHEGRARSLVHQHRDTDRDAEMAFADGTGRTDPPWPLLRGAWSTWRVPVLASRVTVVSDDALSAAIARDCPGARVARVPTGVSDPRRHAASPPARDASAPMRVLVCEDGSPGAVERAAMRARQAGASLELVRVATAEPRAVLDADVVVATRWPSLGRPLRAALVGAAAGRAVVVAETESTASWPALDPQTWQPRAVATGIAAPGAPIAISIDPRDEEHSLVLTLTRLATDHALRSSLGSAARAWWAQHGTVAHAVAAWRTVIEEAVTLPVPPRPAGWPAHLDADGTDRMTAVLDQVGIDVEAVFRPSRRRSA
jgi:hypothetical protein